MQSSGEKAEVQSEFVRRCEMVTKESQGENKQDLNPYRDKRARSLGINDKRLLAEAEMFSAATAKIDKAHTHRSRYLCQGA